MERTIVGFKLDEAQDWTAILSCGHPQHTRHRPPFENRSWVLSEEGRNSMLGQTLQCVRCDEFEIPANVENFKTTPIFTESNVPQGLLTNHQTGPGIWGKIIVLEGKLFYCVMTKGLRLELTPQRIGIVVPELAHQVELVGAVRFQVEFYKCK